MSRVARTLGAAAICALLLACSDDGPAGPIEPPDGAPNHTVRIGGAFHAAGFRDPGTNCVECHGADLRGGEAGEPSCFSCHGRTW